MQVRCPSCSTAYEIPPPTRPRRLRCARCETEWRAPPPDAEAEASPVAPASVETPPETPVHAPADEPQATVISPAGPPAPATVDAAKPPGAPAPLVGVPIRPLVAALPEGRAGGMVWLALWILSLTLIAGASFALWHSRSAVEQDWPATLRLFRLLPGGVPGRVPV